jgi:hypothetical protein
MKARIITTAAFAAAVSLLATAGAASAAPAVHQPAWHASTKVTDRPDGGNGSPQWWADDTMTRTLKITETGGTAGHWTFDAKLTDDGTFTTRKGAQTPNQGPGYAGDTIKSKVTGTMTGTVDYSFTATSLPSSARNLGVPAGETDHGNPTLGFSTPIWYEQAFPSGTTFGGAGIGHWSWTYKVAVTGPVTLKVCVTAHLCWSTTVNRTVHEQWIDAWDNNYGDDATDGNIAG